MVNDAYFVNLTDNVMNQIVPAGFDGDNSKLYNNLFHIIKEGYLAGIETFNQEYADIIIQKFPNNLKG